MTPMNKIQTSVLTCILFGNLSGLGCSTGEVSVGDRVALDRNALASYAASWDGYVEAFSFGSGTDRVRVVLTNDGSGYLQVGDGDVLPAPTTVEAFPNGMAGAYLWLWDQMAYPLHETQVGSERIRFNIVTDEPYAAWCALQPPNLVVQGNDPGTYSCLHGNGVWGPDPSNGQCYDLPVSDTDVQRPAPVDCKWATLCLTCTCTQSGCTNRGETHVSIDGALSEDGNELVGTIVLPSGEGTARTLRLKRQ